MRERRSENKGLNEREGGNMRERKREREMASDKMKGYSNKNLSSDPIKRFKRSAITPTFTPLSN